MKHIPIVLSLCLFFLACGEEPEGDQVPTLVGTWELVEVCFSDGASSCDGNSLKAPDYAETIEFTETGNLEIVRDGSICAGSYTFDGEESIELEADNNICNFDKTTYRVSSLSANEMTLHTPCREACIQVYIRI